MNVISPVASPSHSIASAFDPFAESSSETTITETRTPPPAPSSGAATGATPTGGAALGRKNTLKAYLASKNKLKERQAINIVVNTNTTGQESQAPTSPDVLSPRTAARMDQTLEDLDQQKSKIEERLAAVTKEMLNYQPGHHYTTATGTTITASPTDGIAPSLFDNASAADGSNKVPAAIPGVRPLAELQQTKSVLIAQLDSILKQRRTLLQSWSRDYKNLKRSGSIKQSSPENYWFSPV